MQENLLPLICHSEALPSPCIRAGELFMQSYCTAAPCNKLPVTIRSSECCQDFLTGETQVCYTANPGTVKTTVTSSWAIRG